MLHRGLDGLGAAVGEGGVVGLVVAEFPVDDPVQLGDQAVGVRMGGELGENRLARVEQFAGTGRDDGVVVPEEESSVSAREVDDGYLGPVVAPHEQRIALGPDVFDVEPDRRQPLAQMRFGEFGRAGCRIHATPFGHEADAPGGWRLRS